jgi:hypothetical protein
LPPAFLDEKELLNPEHRSDIVNVIRQVQEQDQKAGAKCISKAKVTGMDNTTKRALIDKICDCSLTVLQSRQPKASTGVYNNATE